MYSSSASARSVDCSSEGRPSASRSTAVLGVESFLDDWTLALARWLVSSHAGRFDPTGTSAPKSLGSDARPYFLPAAAAAAAGAAAGATGTAAGAGGSGGSGGGGEGLGEADGEAVGEGADAIEATGDGTGDPGGDASSERSLMGIRVFYVSLETLAVLCMPREHVRARC